MNLNKIIGSILKPLNPIDISFNRRLPRKPFSIPERFYIIYESVKNKNFKLSILYSLNLIKAIFINLTIIIYMPIIIIFLFLKIKFIRINYWQYGTLFQHSFMALMDIENKKLNSKKIYLYLPKKFSSNPAIINVLKKKIKVIDNLLIGLLLFPLIHFKKTSIDILNYDEHSEKSNSFKIFNKFQQSKNKFYFHSMEENKVLEEKFYENFSFHSSDNYITFQIRNSDFYNDSKYLNRNSSLDNYLEAINYLAELKYKIIMLNSYSELNQLVSEKIRKQIFKFENYKNIFSNQSLELFIRKNSNFFICCNFGPKNVAQMMNVPCLITNCFPYHALFGYGKLDISIPKIIYKNNAKISLREIINSNLFLGQNLRKNNNITFKENTKEDILNATKEMIFQTTKKKQIYDDEFIRKKFITSHPFLEGNGQISKNFIDKNEDLFI